MILLVASYSCPEELASDDVKHLIISLIQPIKAHYSNGIIVRQVFNTIDLPP
jgi:hypothetical protein